MLRINRVAAVKYKLPCAINQYASLLKRVKKNVTPEPHWVVTKLQNNKFEYFLSITFSGMAASTMYLVGCLTGFGTSIFTNITSGITFVVVLLATLP